MLKLYDTLVRDVTEFKPQDKKVTMYSCGPTVYYYAHIGNMRAYLFMDLLRRTLKYNGYEINGVMNITDVGHLTSDADEGEDKMQVASKRENKTPWEIAEFYTNFFMNQTKKLNLDMPENIVKATDEIAMMITMVQTLIKNGFAYETSKGVYYDVEKFEGYGALSGMHVDDKMAGARIEVDSEKRHPADFALWVKAPKEHIMQWQSPWGMGYPGWHIECSAIGAKQLGLNIDIHTGGVDHVHVHHENEIAQNYGYSHEQIVKRWMHVEFLQVDGGKMSKSLGNIYTIDDLEQKGYRALDYRYFTLNAHYRKTQNFTFEAMDASHTTLTRLYEQAIAHKNGTSVLLQEEIDKYDVAFSDAINNDLNAPLALSFVWTMLKSPNKSKQIYNLLLKFDEVLGLNIINAENDIEIAKQNQNTTEIPEEVVLLANKRVEFKKARDFAGADELRSEISKLGYIVIDTKDGFEIKKA